MTAILNEDPLGISQIAPTTPPGLQRIVHRCLEKNPEQRFQSASDLAFALEALSESGISSGVATGEGDRRGPRRALAWSPGLIMIAALAAAVAVECVAAFLTPPPVSGPLDSTQVTFSAEAETGAALHRRVAALF
jgi:hypothetical protein